MRTSDEHLLEIPLGSYGTREEPVTPVHLQTAVSMRNEVAFFVFDVLRIYCNTQILMQRMLYTILQELDTNFSIRLPDELKTAGWFNAAIFFAPALLATVAVKLRNIQQRIASGVGETRMARYATGRYAGAEIYLFSAFSGSVGFMMYDMLRMLVGSDSEKTPSFPMFCVISVLSVFTLTALTTKLAFVDTDDRVTLKDFKQLSGPVFSDVSRFERVLNAACGIGAGAVAASMTVWEVRRELANQTVPLSTAAQALLASSVVVSAGIGALLTDYPKLFHCFLMLSKFTYGFFVSLAAFSGHSYFLQSNPENSNNSLGYLAMWLSFAGCMGMFNAMITRFPFQPNHLANLWIEGQVLRAGRAIRGCVTSCCESPVGDSEASVETSSRNGDGDPVSRDRFFTGRTDRCDSYVSEVEPGSSRSFA